MKQHLAKSLNGFPLQSVLTVRQQTRDAAAADLRNASQTVANVEDKISEVQVEYAAQLASQTVSDGARIDMRTVNASHRFQLHLCHRLESLQAERDEVLSDLERTNADLIKAERELQAIERLRQKHVKHVQAARLKFERLALDEWSGIRHSRTVRK